ncbi:MAG: RecX family transcriptional regulator [Candidatus Shapirobacteria bacterium]|nr:RecX family transcriptional regulator [Candidatus Shapirobacteria bacterium]
MNLESIKASRIPNRVYLRFSDGKYLPFFIDDVVIHSLHSGMDLDELIFKKIVNIALTYLLKDYSLRQIAISPKTTRILTFKLSLYLRRLTKKYQLALSESEKRELIESNILKLKEKGLINDEEYINFFIKKNSRKSRQEIIFLLKKNGIDTSIIPPEKLNNEGDKDKIKNLIIKKIHNSSDLIDFNNRKKVTAYLIRKGFSYDNVKFTIDDLINSR